MMRFTTVTRVDVNKRYRKVQKSNENRRNMVSRQVKIAKYGFLLCPIFEVCICTRQNSNKKYVLEIYVSPTIYTRKWNRHLWNVNTFIEYPLKLVNI